MPIAGTPCSSRASVSSESNRLSSSLALDWPRFLLSTIAFAHSQLSRFYWRSSRSGVLPDGYDASSIAAQALLQFFLHSEGRHSRDPSVVSWALRRYVLREVNRLRHLKENRLLRNEPDLVLVPQPDASAVSPIDLIPDPFARPDEALLEAEAEEQRTRLAERFARILSAEPDLHVLWQHVLAGSSRPRELASAMHLPVRRVENLQKRLRRRWQVFEKACLVKKV
jgi:hypothetical protein